MALSLWHIKEIDGEQERLMSKHLKRDSALREIAIHIDRLKTLTPFQTLAYSESECGTLCTWAIVDDDLLPIHLGVTLESVEEYSHDVPFNSTRRGTGCGGLSTAGQAWYDPKTRA